jgi:hypothetical protein
MQKGQVVTVTDAWGNKLKRKVVSVSDRKVYVCKSEELANATQARREPKAVGFPVEHVELAEKSP